MSDTISDREGSRVQVGDNFTDAYLKQHGYCAQQMYLHLIDERIVAFDRAGVIALRALLDEWLDRSIGDRYACLKDAAGNWAVVDLDTDKFVWVIDGYSRNTVDRFLSADDPGWDVLIANLIERAVDDVRWIDGDVVKYESPYGVRSVRVRIGGLWTYVDGSLETETVQRLSDGYITEQIDGHYRTNWFAVIRGGEMASSRPLSRLKARSSE